MLLNKKKVAVAGAIAAITAGLTALVPAVNSQGRATIEIDGSSTVYPITQAVAEEFPAAQQGRVRVTVGISGTGGGFKKFCAGETDISDASRPIKDSEKELCKANGIEYEAFPVAFDAISVVVKKGSPITSLTVDELNKMWTGESQGNITRWNQINSSFPNAPLVLFGPGTDSGTYDYFKSKIVGKKVDMRTDFTPSEDDNVLVTGVSRDDNALGYFGLAYYLNNTDKLQAVAIDNGNGPVLPSKDTVISGDYKPLSRPIFIYVNKKSIERREVKSFVEFYLNTLKTDSETNGNFLSTIGYVPLPATGEGANTYAAAMSTFNAFAP